MIKKAEFLKSSADPQQCPKPDRPEYAFIGRSNVGKSSLINMLCGRKGLAKTSGRPGKTQLINHFNIDDKWYLVDLPGYGYAKISKKQRAKWKAFTWSYLMDRENLLCVFVLVDGRIEPQEVDLEFMEELGKRGIPFVIVFTKLEKVNESTRAQHLEKYSKAMLETWEKLPQLFHTSAVSKEGRQEILDLIEKTNEMFLGYSD
ncbi:MAG: YihA family ribosome biogenesis GTP-binding protein [Flavobacteriales bacterium]|nr:YihA family ribosome biogenesis GTP-binding protein [Flavobacteriales bacterium]